MRKTKTKLLGLVAIVAVILTSLIGATMVTLPAQAEDDFANKVMKIVIVNAARKCYNGGYLKNKIFLNDYIEFSSLIDSKDNKNAIKVPTMVGNTRTDSVISCAEVFQGAKGGSGSNSAPGMAQLFAPISSNKVDALAQLGYTASSTAPSDGTIGCLSFEYIATFGEGIAPQHTAPLCLKFDDNKLSDETYLSGSYTSPEDAKASDDIKLGYNADQKQVWVQLADASPITTVGVTPGMSWDTLKAAFEQKAIADLERNTGGKFTYIRFTSDDADNKQYTKSPSFTIEVFRGVVKDPNAQMDYAYNLAIKAQLYATYIQNEISNGNIGEGQCFASKSEAKQAIKNQANTYLFHRSNSQWCEVHVNGTNLSGKKYNGWSAQSGNGVMDAQYSIEELLEEQLKDMYDNQLTGIKDDPSYLDGTAGSDDSTGETTPSCWTSAESLGWIMCPVIKGLSNALQGIYGYVESNFLMIKAEFMGSDGGIHNGWTTFRDMANIVFLILIILVILSQVTGIGITNYGIKKVLPRLIAVAILANLSFIICQLAVDATNLLGVGLKNLFKNLSANQVSVTDFTANLSKALFGTVVSGSVVAIGAVAAVHTWELWLPAILLFLLTTLISVIFFAIILGVRQAGIIILIALSPVAIVCYALPNTQKIFDKWFKLFTSLLLVFPICGALMGGGIYASTLMLSATEGAEEGAGFFFTLVAMLMQVVPFFLVPGLVKNSLALAGNIGTKISNFGSRAGAGITKGIRSSEAFKDTQDRLRAHNAETFLGRSEWRQRHRVLGAPGRVAERIGGAVRGSNTAVGRFAQSNYDRRRTRAINTAIAQRLATQNAGYIAGAGFEAQAQRAEDAAKSKHIDDMAKDIISANHAIATNDDELQKRHAAAIAAYDADQSDENAAAIQAYQDLMATSDNGRRSIFDNYAQAAQSGSVEGLRTAANHLMRDHVKDIKPTDRDLFGLAAQASNMGDDGSGLDRNFQEFTDKKNKTHYFSKQHGEAGIGGYDASTIGKADEGTLDRMIAMANAGQLGIDEMDQLDQYTRTALTSDTIHVQGKIETKLNDLREAMHRDRIATASADEAGDSGIDIDHTRASSNGSDGTNAAAANPNQTNTLHQNPDGSYSGTVSQPGVWSINVSNATMSQGGILLPGGPTSNPRSHTIIGPGGRPISSSSGAPVNPTPTPNPTPVPSQSPTGSRPSLGNFQNTPIRRQPSRNNQPTRRNGDHRNNPRRGGR